MLATASADDFNTALAVLGALLVGGALIAGIARRSFLSLTAAFVLAGLALGHGGLEVLDFRAQSAFVADLAVIALVVILFRDGLEVEQEMLQSAWHLPFRKLVLAMPITCGLVALATHALTSLDWTESFLVGALLSPTDPVLSSSVVTNPRVPRVVRHSLNLESGLNDGLALPAVLALASSLDPGESGFVWWQFVLQDLAVGFATGILVGFAASWLMPRAASAHQKALFGLGIAFASYGIAVLPPEGNGLIGAFVAAIVLGIRRPDIREAFETRSEDVIEIVKLGIFVVFGALLTFDGLFGDGGTGLAIAGFTLLIARPVAVLMSLIGTRTDLATRGFMGWFGPKGVATMTFSILVLSRGLEHGQQIFDIASVAVLVSILAHGLTDHAGSNWIAERGARRRDAVPA